MNREKITINRFGEELVVERISKREAFHRFNRIKETIVCPYNANLKEHLGWVIRKEGEADDFNKLVRHIISEMHYLEGTYLKYYKQI